MVQIVGMGLHMGKHMDLLRAINIAFLKDLDFPISFTKCHLMNIFDNCVKNFQITGSFFGTKF